MFSEAVFELFSEAHSSLESRMDVIKLTLVSLAGWMSQHQQHVIDYLQEEVGVLKEEIALRGYRRLRFTDDQRSRLACKAKRIRFGKLKEVAYLVTP